VLLHDVRRGCLTTWESNNITNELKEDLAQSLRVDTWAWQLAALGALAAATATAQDRYGPCHTAPEDPAVVESVDT
jgi:hypothetical protein